MSEVLKPRNSGEKNGDPREFSFFEYQDGLAETIATKNIGTFSELKQTLYGDSADPFPNANRLLKAFDTARIPGRMSDQAAQRRPHLLISGGFVRDVLMSKRPKDIDFVSNATYEEIVSILNEGFTDEIKSKAFWLDETGKKFKVVRCKCGSEEYEIASLRSDSEESDGRRPDEVTQEVRPGRDVMRRDLTANALLYNPRTGTVIDYVGGLKDIDEKKLRFVGDPEKRINEDTLRALRYVRFLFRTGFQEDEHAKETIRRMAEHVVSTLPGARVTDELKKMLAVYPPRQVIEKLDEYGLLGAMLPEVTRLKECPQSAPYHMEGDVFTHTLMVIDKLPPGAPLELIWAAILHDVEKPSTRTEVDDPQFGKRMKFKGHEAAGAKTARAVLGKIERFQYSSDFIATVEWLVANHLRIFEFMEMSESKARQMMAHPAFELLLQLGQADALGSHPHPSVEATAFGGEHSRELFARIRQRADEMRRFADSHSEDLSEVKKAVNGVEVMKMFKEIHGKELKGKLVGVLKDLVAQRVGDARIIDPVEARAVMEKAIREYAER